MDYHPLSAKQKGGVGEALLTAHSNRAADVVSDWIRNDLSRRISGELGDIKVSHDHRVETYYVNHEGTHMSWTPDCLFTAIAARAFGTLRSSNGLRVDYPVEIKTGDYAALERNQRTVMELVGTNQDIVPVVAKIDIAQLPDEFGVAFSTVELTE